MNSSNDLVSIEKLAQILGVPKSTLYCLCSAGRIPYFKIGKRLRFDTNLVLSACFRSINQEYRTPIGEQELGSLKTEYSPQKFQNLEDPFS